MKSTYFPIVLSSKDAELVRGHYADASACRVLIDSGPQLIEELPGSCGVWLDGGFDGFPQNARLCRKMHEETGTPPNSWYNYVMQLPAFDMLADENFTEKDGRHKLAKNEQESLKKTVFAVLDDCLRLSPTLITVPQLPQGKGAARNCVNRALSIICAEWARDRQYQRLVYPLIFSGLEGQTEDSIWKRKIDRAIDYSRRAEASFFWMVDASLDEEKASGTFRTERFPRLIEIHEYLQAELTQQTIVGGPYWGLNILLWSRGIIESPVIAIGSGFRYYLSGGIPRSPIPRAAIPPLRRLAFVDPQLATWFDNALNKLSPSEPEFSELREPREQLDSTPRETLDAVAALEEKGTDEVIYQELVSAGLGEQKIDRLAKQLRELSEETQIRAMSDQWRDQVARFYKEWLASISKAPANVRKLRLYQQLSSAFMLGKVLGGQIVSRTGYAPDPSAHAEQLMHFCL